jgi:spore germination protein GerM
VCTLNFNQAFYDNRPQSESQERVLIYAIVNSVSELSAVDAVRFLVEGEKIGLYYYLDLSLDYTFDENAVGPVRTAVNEFDGTVYLQGADPDYLAAVPLRVHQTANQTAEEALMEALLNVTPPTGMTNPIPSDTELLEISIVGYCCYVNLSSEFDSASAAAVRSIVLSLSALQDVTTVQIEVEGEPYTSIMGASSTWTYPNP